jgi:hypothetical protein
MKVRVNSFYYYHPNLLDRIDGRTTLGSGDFVKVVNRYGCPKANVMGHCYVELVTSADGLYHVEKIGGLVSTNSLYTHAEYIAYLRSAIAAKEAAAVDPTLEGVL